MAFINKLFSSRKKAHAKHQDNVCERLFAFTSDQVRVVLFLECDFRGRKLLFDSSTIQKIPINDVSPKQDVANLANTSPSKKFIEVSNGYGYIWSKPADTVQLGEMVFGSVAMSYRGTSYKIHKLSSPPRLMCTKVFPSPRRPGRGTRSSAPTQRSSSWQSLDHSMKFDDSGVSCTTSSSEPLSVHSTTSDTLLVCRGSRSVPLDVPLPNGNTPSNIPYNGDSGCGGEQSCSSTGSGSFAALDATVHGFSSGSLYKRWLRSASTSLEYSTSSLNGSASADECYTKPHNRPVKLALAIMVQLTQGHEDDMERFFMEHAALVEGMVTRARQGTELAVNHHANFFSQMQDVANTASQWLVNLLSGPRLNVHVWLSLVGNCDNSNSIKANRTFCSISQSELAISSEVKRTSSLNVIKSKSSDQWGSCNWLNRSTHSNRSSQRNRLNQSNSSNWLNTSNWLNSNQSNGHQLPNDCQLSNGLQPSNSCQQLNGCQLSNDCKPSTNPSSKCNLIISDQSSSCESTSSGDFTLLNLSQFLRSEWEVVSGKKNNVEDSAAEKFIKELCELLKIIDVKHTNFFLSTLITAVLTHHLGWIATSIPPTTSDKETISELTKTCNPLWGQLTDLYGAIGHPTKVAHTIVNGTNKSEIVPKILNILTYFIRCCEVRRKNLSRVNIEEENQIAHDICQENACIPKENYKKYEDHLREIAVVNEKFSKMGGLNSGRCTPLATPLVKRDKFDFSELKTSVDCVDSCLQTKPSVLKKTSTCFNDLTHLEKNGTLDKYEKLEKYCKLDDYQNSENQTLIYLQKSLDYQTLKNNEHLEKFDKPTLENEFSKTVVCEKDPKEIRHDLLDKVTSLGLQAFYQPEIELTLPIDEVSRKVQILCRVPKSAIIYHMQNEEKQNLIDIQEAREQIEKVFSPKKNALDKRSRCNEFNFGVNKVEELSNVFGKCNEQEKMQNIGNQSFDIVQEIHQDAMRGVIFVLGDDEKLIGLKKENLLPMKETNRSMKETNCSIRDTNCPMNETDVPIKDNEEIYDTKETLNMTNGFGYSKNKYKLENYKMDRRKQSVLNNGGSLGNSFKENRGENYVNGNTEDHFVANENNQFVTNNQEQFVPNTEVHFLSNTVVHVPNKITLQSNEHSIKPNRICKRPPNLDLSQCSRVGTTRNFLTQQTTKLKNYGSCNGAALKNIEFHKPELVKSEFSKPEFQDTEVAKPEFQSSPAENLLPQPSAVSAKKPTTLNIPGSKTFYCNSSDRSLDEIVHEDLFKNLQFKDTDFEKFSTEKYSASFKVKPSSSWVSLPVENVKKSGSSNNLENACGSSSSSLKEVMSESTFVRSQSVPPEEKAQKDDLKETKSKYRYSGVKFNFQQYPQILPNYMRSKNIELSNLPFPEKKMDFNKVSTNFDFPACEDEFEEGEALQTPSNASELEYVSELAADKQEVQYAQEKSELSPKTFVRMHVPNTLVKDLSPKELYSKNLSPKDLDPKELGSETISSENSADLLLPKDVDRFVEKDIGGVVGKDDDELKEKDVDQLIKIGIGELAKDVGEMAKVVAETAKDGDVAIGKDVTGLMVKNVDVLVEKDPSLPVTKDVDLLVTTDVAAVNTGNSYPITYRTDGILVGVSKEKERYSLQIVQLPMPKSIEQLPYTNLSIGYTSSLMRGVSDHYISDMVLQGTSAPKKEWESLLKRDLVLATRYPLLDQPVQEAVAIVANTDNWEVQLISSHTYVIDRGSTGVRIGMSQLVANMLESVLDMWKCHMPPEYCVNHIEQRLQEFCLQSKALAQLLLETDFCSMELLTKTLHLEINDVPLLMAIASTHSPQLMQKYGLSFS